jgi:hypothetical protein
MATDKIQELCNDFLFYLLDERDENHIIMTKIYDEDWENEDECELWVNAVLLNYLGNGLDYRERDQFIPKYDIQNWKGPKVRELMSEIIKDEYNDEINTLYESLKFWRIDSGGFYTSIIFNYCYRLVYDRSYADLIQFLKTLYESNSIMPK